MAWLICRLFFPPTSSYQIAGEKQNSENRSACRFLLCFKLFFFQFLLHPKWPPRWNALSCNMHDASVVICPIFNGLLTLSVCIERYGRSWPLVFIFFLKIPTPSQQVAATSAPSLDGGWNLMSFSFLEPAPVVQENEWRNWRNFFEWNASRFRAESAENDRRVNAIYGRVEQLGRFSFFKKNWKMLHCEGNIWL